MSGSSTLLMAFGQSNADVHDAGPRQIPAGPQDGAIVAPNDGYGIRGLMGRPLDSRIDGFVHASEVEHKIQSLLAAAAMRLLQDSTDPDLARVIVRSEARGGRRFIGWTHEDRTYEGIYRNVDGRLAQALLNLIATIRACVAAARADGMPITQLPLIWLHGESDRAMPRDTYADLLEQVIDTVQDSLSDLDLIPDWYLVQACGTGSRGSGNDWPNRLAIFDVARKRPNVEVIATGYAYPMEDGSHYSARGKILLGENLGRLIAERDRGVPNQMPEIFAAMMDNRDLFLEFDTEQPLTIDRTSMIDESGLAGFEVSDRAGPCLRSVEQTGPDTLRLRLSRAPDVDSLRLSYAYARTSRRPAACDTFPSGRGHLRGTRSVSSRHLPDASLYDWAAGFQIPSDQIERDV